jgi:hypothetical protein
MTTLGARGRQLQGGSDVRYARDVAHRSGATRSTGDQLRRRPKSLADEVGRAAESIALNVGEARQRAGLDHADLFRRAAGSASGFTTALRMPAPAYITPADFVAVDEVLDRVRAMLWWLAH